MSEPRTIEEVVARCKYKQDWEIDIWTPDLYTPQWTKQSPKYLRITVQILDSSGSGKKVTVSHTRPMPNPLYGPLPAGMAERFVFDAIMGVERHEAGEFFQIGEEFPFWPKHPGDQ